ncbi:MAG TPA: hypothetical protein VHT03_13125 [Rhizomicrobium sp.]|jgi:hypothetical protein|nr:hypothetical protein [Rhizomicrobium sp.]
MTRLGKIVAGALVMAGTTLGTTAALTTPADARVVVGVGIGVPGYYPAYPCCGYYGYGYPYYGYPAYYGGYYGPYVGVGWGWRAGWHPGWGWRGRWGWRGWHGGWRR